MERLLKLAKELEPSVIGWRRIIHRYAEPGNREYRTAELVEQEAARLGLRVLDGGLTSRIAVLDTGKPDHPRRGPDTGHHFHSGRQRFQCDPGPGPSPGQYALF